MQWLMAGVEDQRLENKQNKGCLLIYAAFLIAKKEAETDFIVDFP